MKDLLKHQISGLYWHPKLESSVRTYPTLIAGKTDSENDEVISSNRIRREGADSKPATEIYPNITEAIEKIIDGNTYGDPSKEYQSPL